MPQRAARKFCSRLPRVLVLTTLGLVLGSGVAQAGATVAATANEPRSGYPGFACEKGEFCGWSEEFHRGDIVRMDLRNTNPDECVPLPDGMEARSFATRIERHVTVYQDAECSTEGDFSTYPGPGTFVPQAPYVVRAIQIWN